MSIIKKYGGVSTDTSWVNELNVIEKKNERKHSYLNSQRDSESVASSIQEEARIAPLVCSSSHPVFSLPNHQPGPDN